jgi:Protein of unknown function (DUF1566)
MHIETININVHQGESSSVARAFIEALLRGPELSEAPDASNPAPAAAPVASNAPKIGEYWTGQGGIYAGVARGLEGAPDYHLILCKEDPKKDCTWQAALDLAKTITADGHSDFRVPTRFESALLYASLHDQFEADRWHWTSTQYSENYAWDQYFHDGYQYYSIKDYERRCRFVRSASI